MALQVKTILHRGPNENELPRKEIRRFEIEETAIGSYDYFRQKITTLYPDLSHESPFRLMWTDDEGDNVCFSSDEELQQAIKFIQSQENKLFKCIVKFPQPQGQQQQPGSQQQQQPQQPAAPRQAAVNFAQNFAHNFPPFPAQGACNMNWNEKKMEKMNEKIKHKIAKMQAKMQDRSFAQQDAQNEMMKHMQQHWAQMGNVTKCTVDKTNGDVEMHVDIPIHHSDGTSTCTNTVTTTVDQDGKATTSSASNVYPNLNKETQQQQETTSATTTTTESNQSSDGNDFEDLTQEASEAKLNEAVTKMAELGFSGQWVRELLKNVNGDIAKAVEAMNPSK